jgi:hypothetical protein
VQKLSTVPAGKSHRPARCRRPADSSTPGAVFACSRRPGGPSSPLQQWPGIFIDSGRSFNALGGTIPLTGIAAEKCAAAFISGWVSRFGIPAALTSDRGVQFALALWAAIMARLGVKHKMTTAFHPQSKGLVERFHRRLKDALRARAAAADWPDHVPWVLLGLRAAPREDSGVSAAELVYGAPMVLPGQFLTAAEPPPEEFIRQLTSGTPCVAPREAPAEEVSSQSAGALKKLMAVRFVYVRSPAAAPSLSPA